MALYASVPAGVIHPLWDMLLFLLAENLGILGLTFSSLNVQFRLHWRILMGFEQPGLGEGVPARGKGVGT